MTIEDNNDARRFQRIRSYVLRTGRLTAAQERALATHADKWCLPFAPSVLNFDAVFGRTAPTVLEIGFGMGDTTAEIAARQPETNFIGIEVHTPGVGHLLGRIEERGLANLRLIQHDAVEVLEQMIAPESLFGVHVFFPDPWHKKRHHKRRLLQAAFVHQLALRLKPGGYLHCATDWEDYANAILEVIDNEPLLRNDHQGYAPRPETRPQTKFEARGLRLGHQVFDIVASRKYCFPD